MEQNGTEQNMDGIEWNGMWNGMQKEMQKGMKLYETWNGMWKGVECDGMECAMKCGMKWNVE